MKKGKITHGYICQDFWDYEQFLEICNNLNKISRRKGWWLRLIKSNKLTCPETGLVVKYVSLDMQEHKNGNSTFHYNFYSECGELFTVDHIIPRSKGGAINDVKNLQPMIAQNNWDKGNDLPYHFNQMADKQEIYGKTLQRPIKPKDVRNLSHMGNDLFVKSMRYGDLPQDLLPESVKGKYHDEHIVDIKIRSNWGIDLSDGMIKIIPENKACENFFSEESLGSVVDQIKKGGKHSEHILKSFLNNYLSLHNEQE